MKTTMHRVICLIMALLLLVPMTVSLSGCQETNPDESGSGNNSNKVVRMYNWGGEPTEAEKAKEEAFTEKTGIAVEKVNVSWENIDMQFVLDMAGGTPVDVVYMQCQKFPKYAIQGIVTPLDELLEKDDPLWQLNGLESFRFGNKYYGICTGASPLLLWYNKTMFEENDVKTPLEYYKEGNWNWETFADVAKKLTVVGSDGTTQVWGYSSWRFDAFVSSNAGKFMNFEADGNITLGLEQPKTYNALQFMQDACYKDKWMDPTGNFTWFNDFRNGKVAMTCEEAFLAWDGTFEGLTFEVDFAPYPLGSDNTEGLYPGDADGLGVCASAKNKENAIEWIRFGLDWGKEHKEDSDMYKTLTTEQYELVQTLSKNKMETNFFMGVGNTQNIQFGLWNSILTEGQPIATALAKEVPGWQNEIDTCLADNTLPEVTPFTAVPDTDFTDGLGEYVLNYTDEATYGVTASEIVADGIDGSSLKVTCKKDSDMGSLLLTSNPEKVTLPGYHKYEISIDYKVLEDFEVGGYMALCLRPADDPFNGMNVGWVELNEGLTAGASGTISAEITPIEDIENLSVVLLAVGGGTVLLDNVHIADAAAS